MQPINPRPGTGHTGGTGGTSSGSISYPPDRPRMIELQIDAASLGDLVMNRLRAESICAGQEFTLSSSEDAPVYVVDHVECNLPAVLGDPPPHHGSALQIIVSVTLFTKLKDDLLNPAKTNHFSELQPTLKLFFSVTGESGELCLTYNTMTSTLPLPSDATVAINNALASISLCSSLNLSALPGVLGDLTVSKAKVASDPEFSILSMRLELGDTPANEGVWHSFANAPVQSFLDGNDWAILLRSSMVVGAFEQLVAGMTLTRDDISVSSGPTGHWHSGPFQISEDDNKTFDGGVSLSLSGDSWAVGCDIGFSATIQAGLRVPSENTINVTIGLDISPNYWDAFWCFGPIGDIAAAAYTFTPNADDIPNACTLKKSSLIVCSYPIDLAPLTLGSSIPFGTLVLKKYFATAAGPILGGKLVVQHVGKPKLTIDAGGFTWGILGGCGHFHIGTVGQLSLTGSALFSGPPVRLCQNIQVLGDTLNIFAPHMVIKPNDGWLPLDVTFNFEPGDLPLDSPYWQNPYPLVLLIETNAGCRTVSLGNVATYTDQQLSNLGLQIPELEANCDAPQTGLFGIAGQFDPHWLIDPEPDYTNIWESMITGANPGDVFELSDASGIVSRSVASVAGKAQLTGLFPAGGTLRVKRIAESGKVSGQAATGSASPATTGAQTAASGKAPAQGDASPPRLHERQMALRRRHQIELQHEVTFLAGDRLDGIPILIAAAGGALTVFDISSPGFPKIIGEAAARGAVSAGNDLVYWSDRGLALWDGKARHEAVVSACLRVGEHLAALTSNGLEIFDAALRPVGHLDLPNRGMLVTVKRRLLVAVPDGLAVVDIANASRPSVVGTAPIAHIEALSPWSGPRPGGTVTIQRSNNEFVTLDATELPNVRPLATYHRKPWAFGAARLGNWWARLEEERGRIAIYTPGRTQTTYGP